MEEEVQIKEKTKSDRRKTLANILSFYMQKRLLKKVLDDKDYTLENFSVKPNFILFSD